MIRIERRSNDKIVKVGGKVKDRLRSRGKLEMRYAREEVIGGYWGKFEGAYGVDVNMVRDGGKIYE